MKFLIIFIFAIALRNFILARDKTKSGRVRLRKIQEKIERLEAKHKNDAEDADNNS